MLIVLKLEKRINVLNHSDTLLFSPSAIDGKML